MKRRSFLKKSALTAGSVSIAMPLMAYRTSDNSEKGLYEFRIYHISRAVNAKNLLEQYFKDALIPFLNKNDVKLAAFNDYSLEEPVKLYVLMAYPNVSAYFTVQSELNTDAAFLDASNM